MSRLATCHLLGSFAVLLLNVLGLRFDMFQETYVAKKKHSLNSLFSLLF